MEPLGDALGDAHGDAPFGGVSPPFGGKFWCLAVEDEEEAVRVEQSPRSSEVYRRSSLEVSASSSARYVKRLQKRFEQRRAAMLLSISPGESRI
jgi:hypothetical protein